MITPILPLSDKALEALSYVIVTATEGGHYTREDYAEWTTYVHKDTPKGFYAEVTLHPNDDVEGISLEPIRMTPQELGKRLAERFNLDKMPAHHALMILRLLKGDEDIAGEMDVIDSGAILQVAVYGETIYG
jgi:hypothetical protein